MALLRLSKLTFWSTWAPISYSPSIISRYLPWMKEYLCYLGPLLSRVMFICLHLSGWKPNNSFSLHSIRFEWLSCGTSYHFLGLTPWISLCRQQIGRHLIWLCLGGHWYKLRITSDVAGIQPGHSWPMKACWVHPVMNLSIHPMISSDMPYGISFPIGLLCDSVECLLEIHVDAIYFESYG